jgi:hypothetical protein
MARAYGSSVHLLMKRESAYGQAGTGNYIRMSFNRCNLGSEQSLIDDPVLAAVRDLPLRRNLADESDPEKLPPHHAAMGAGRPGRAHIHHS